MDGSGQSSFVVQERVFPLRSVCSVNGRARTLG